MEILTQDLTYFKVLLVVFVVKTGGLTLRQTQKSVSLWTILHIKKNCNDGILMLVFGWAVLADQLGEHRSFRKLHVLWGTRALCGLQAWASSTSGDM